MDKMIKVLLFLLFTTSSAYGVDIEQRFLSDQRDLKRENFYPEYQSDQYFYHRLNLEFFELNSFFSNEYREAITCPKSEYKKYKEKIHFSFRLMALNHLYQSLAKYEAISKNFEFNNLCRFNWKEIFKECKSKTTDMTFFKRSMIHFGKEISSTSSSVTDTSITSRKNWLSKLKSNQSSDLAQVRIINSKVSKDPKRLSKSLNTICKDDLAEFMMICSELDRNFGYSYSPSLFNSVIYSGLLNDIEDNYLYGCTRRYVEESRGEEAKKYYLNDLFKFSFENPSPEESIYEYGLLKSISDKGLVSIFSGATPETEDEGIKLVASKSKEKKPEFEKITLKKIKAEKKRIKKVKTNLRKEVKKKDLSSTFLLASKFRRKNLLQEVKLDMFKFKNDYIFGSKQRQTIAKSISKFTEPSALKEMKSKDKLGSIKAPFPLTFIKFLIDENMHYALFNITNVIGETFYVVNNIDIKVKNIEHIKLINNIENNNKWELTIIEN